jgi:hypothetical protein
LDLRFSAPVKPKLCMAAIAGLALVNRIADTDATDPLLDVFDRRRFREHSPRTAIAASLDSDMSTVATNAISIDPGISKVQE